MSYPTDIPAFRAALLDYEPAATHAEAIYAAQGRASPVSQSVEAFQCLRGAVADLDASGLRLLAGAAHLIAAGGWHGLAGDAIDTLQAASARLAQLDI
jgi:hypothetical protein